jgi:hypothetical protein
MGDANWSRGVLEYWVSESPPLYRVVECFDELMLRQAQQNGKNHDDVKSSPLVLSLTKDSERVSQHPATPTP